MALTKDVVLNNGLVAPQAYIRVEEINIYKGKMSFEVKKYTDTSKPYFSTDSISCEYNLNGDNPYIQAYEHIKTIPEYQGAKDI